MFSLLYRCVTIVVQCFIKGRPILRSSLPVFVIRCLNRLSLLSGRATVTECAAVGSSQIDRQAQN